MNTMTPDARRARIVELQAELDQLRAEEAAALAADPVALAQRARQWWTELRVGLHISLEDFERLLEECRVQKQSSPAAACRIFRDRLEISMQVASNYIRLL